MSTKFIPKATTAAMVALALCVVAGVMMHPPLRAQSSQSQAAKTELPTPQWQIDAGGSARFDVASVKQAGPDGQYHSNVPLDAWNSFARTGGLFSATSIALTGYITFAYKVSVYESRHTLPPQLPKWAKANRYDIQARATGDPNKDQYRLMMQALLADRFKLAVHRETRQIPVFALVLDKPGKLGPKLRPHLDNPPCAAIGISENFNGARYIDGFPATCGLVSGEVVRGHDHFAGRNLTMSFIGDMLGAGWDDPGRPIVDQTGLTGNFDFSIEYTPNAPSPSGLQPFDPNGPTYTEALKEQLGLRLESTSAPVDILVIDHIEEPSPN